MDFVLRPSVRWLRERWGKSDFVIYYVTKDSADFLPLIPSPHVCFSSIILWFIHELTDFGSRNLYSSFIGLTVIQNFSLYALSCV